MLDTIYAFAGDLQSALQGPPKLAAKPSRSGKVATVEIVGTISRTGEYGTSSDQTASDIAALAADAKVGAIELRINSPGGAVAGTFELAASVASASKLKPVFAYITDLGASAAYWVASQATNVYGNQTALVGSIGTYSVVRDTSGLASALGVKVHVVKAGQHKGSGVPGSQVTDEQLAEVQRTVDAINQHFLAGVAAGRKIPLARVQELADGRVHVGQEAEKLGLIDGVLSYDSFRSQLQAAFSSQSQMKGSSDMFYAEKKHGVSSEAFWSEVESRIKDGKSRERAIEQVVSQEPDLHQAMLAEVNSDRR